MYKLITLLFNFILLNYTYPSNRVNVNGRGDSDNNLAQVWLDSWYTLSP